MPLRFALAQIAPRPSDQAEAWKTLYAVVEEHISRLEALLERNKDMEAEEANDWVDRAALDLSPEFERHRRYLSAKTRELHKTLETLRKMQESDRGNGKCQMTYGTCEMTDGESQMTDGESQMTDGESEMTDGKCEMTDGESQMTDGESQMTDGESQMTDGESQMTDGKCQMAEDKGPTADDQCLRAVPEEVTTNQMCQAAEGEGPASVESELPGAVRNSIPYGPAMSEKNSKQSQSGNDANHRRPRDYGRVRENGWRRTNPIDLTCGRPVCGAEERRAASETGRHGQASFSECKS